MDCSEYIQFSHYVELTLQKPVIDILTFTSMNSDFENTNEKDNH